MKGFLILAVLLLAGCSTSPTSPSAVSSLAPSAPNLRWDIVASGCTPTAAPLPLPDPNTVVLSPQSDGSIMASAPYTSPTGRPVLLYARFLETSSGLALCSWDTADV